MREVDLFKKMRFQMVNIPKANKDLGQHYLTSEKVIEKICSDHENQYDAIIEVGPGPGVLTKSLAKKNVPLYLIEMDTRFRENLEELVAPENILFQDATTINWDDFFIKNNLLNKNVWLVSNLPYNVGSVLFIHFLPLLPIKFMTLMFQKEVGQKTYFREVKNQMNGLYFLCKNYFESKHLIKVSPGCFSPPPKVESVVVSYERNSNSQELDFKKLNSFSRLVFSERRKQLMGVLKKKYSKEKLEESFNFLGIPPMIRSEALTYDQLQSLYQLL